MFRNGVEIRTEDGINFLLTHCALGDGVSSLPAICWARKMHSIDMRMTVWAPEHMLPLFEHLIGGPGLRFMPLHDFKEKLKQGDENFAGACVINTTPPPNTVTRNRFDLVEYAYATLLDRQVDSVAEKCYPHWAPLGPRPYDDRYAILPVGATNDVSVFHQNALTGIIEYLVDRGIKPVITGSHNTHVHTIEKGKPVLLVVRDAVDALPAHAREACLDLRNQTTLMQLRDWCGHADVVAGIDGGTLHLAGTTDVPIVYGCTRTSPRHRGIVRNNEMNWNLEHVVPRDLECSGCQSNWTLMFRHNFKDCLYSDAKCIEQMHADDFITAMETLGV